MATIKNKDIVGIIERMMWHGRITSISHDYHNEFTLDEELGDVLVHNKTRNMINFLTLDGLLLPLVAEFRYHNYPICHYNNFQSKHY
jgi:hypothetical protein